MLSIIFSCCIFFLMPNNIRACIFSVLSVYFWCIFIYFSKLRYPVVVQSLSHVWLFVTPWTIACQASLSAISQSLFKLRSIESVIASNHLILCCPLLLLPSIFPSIKVFSNESALYISVILKWTWISYTCILQNLKKLQKEKKCNWYSKTEDKMKW